MKDIASDLHSTQIVFIFVRRIENEKHSTSKGISVNQQHSLGTHSVNHGQLTHTHTHKHSTKKMRIWSRGMFKCVESFWKETHISTLYPFSDSNTCQHILENTHTHQHQPWNKQKKTPAKSRFTHIAPKHPDPSSKKINVAHSAIISSYILCATSSLSIRRPETICTTSEPPKNDKRKCTYLQK